jgi:hypothetical protein
MIQARTLTILVLLGDLKHAFETLLREKRKNPALLNIYSFIDICAALTNDGKTDNRVIFETCLAEFATMARKPFSTYDLWAARCSLLHAYSPLGRHTEKLNGARPIFYYAWPERQDEMEAALKARGYTDFILLNVEDIKWVAIDVLNTLHRRVESDLAFERRFLDNAQHFLYDLQAFKLEAELSMLQELGRRRRGDA